MFPLFWFGLLSRGKVWGSFSFTEVARQGLICSAFAGVLRFLEVKGVNFIGDFC